MKTNIYRIKESILPQNVSGKGGKGLMIVIESTDKAENISTLEGLVKAIKFDIEDDVTIVSLENDAVSLNSLLSSKAPSTLILIGVSPDQIGFTIKAQPYFFYKMEGFSILLTDSLRVMNADKDKKMKFWQNLQARFLA